MCTVCIDSIDSTASLHRKHQQYDYKWYVPLAELVFPSPEESESCPHVHAMPDHDLEDMKIKISSIKSEVQKEVCVVGR